MALAILTVGCRSSNPKPVLPQFGVADRFVYGGWIVVTPKSAPKKHDIAGELIAVGPDRLYMQTAAGRVEVPKSDVGRARLQLYDAKTIAPKVTAGMLLSITNGAFMVLTIPMWALAGGNALREVNVMAEIDYPPSAWELLSNGARFPQGLPSDAAVNSTNPPPSAPSQKSGSPPVSRPPDR